MASDIKRIAAIIAAEIAARPEQVAAAIGLLDEGATVPFVARYRNKWYQTGAASGAFCGIGIHGQWLYVDPKAEVVIAKMSSQPEPVDEPLDVDMVAFFEALSRIV